MLKFLRNSDIAPSKKKAIELLNSDSIKKKAGDGTLIEARYSDGDAVKTIFALYHISEDKKTATIYDSEAYIEPDTEINTKIAGLSGRLDAVDGGSGGTTGEPSLINKVNALINNVGDKNKLATSDKESLVKAINELVDTIDKTDKKIGTVPVLEKVELRREGDYDVNPTTGEITNKPSFASSDNDKEGLLMVFSSKDSNDKPQIKSVFVDFEKIFMEAEVGNGLKFDDKHKMHINVATDDETKKYLSVNSKGLKFTGLDTEIQARKDGDSELDKQIKAEAKAREDADKELDGKIKTETTNRTAADKELAKQIKAEATARGQADTKLGEKITAIENSIDQKIKDVTSEINLSDYLTTDDAKKTYQPKGDYVTTKVANDTYQPKGNYLTTDTAKTTYATKEELLDDEEVTAASLNDLNTRLKAFESGPSSVSAKINALEARIKQLEAKVQH